MCCEGGGGVVLQEGVGGFYGGEGGVGEEGCVYQGAGVVYEVVAEDGGGEDYCWWGDVRWGFFFVLWWMGSEGDICVPPLHASALPNVWRRANILVSRPREDTRPRP